MKRCPFCAEEIQDQAIKCKYCQSMLDGTRTWPTTFNFTRSKSDRMLAGVCGGIAESSDMDVTVVRLLAVLLVMATGGFGIVGYVILAIIVPEGE